MPDNPTVSVIINTFNRSGLIARAVDSVLQQDFQDFELLLMDASTNEETRAIIEKYSDSRIRYQRILNEKYFAQTFNQAIMLARGKYIAFIDDDDEWISPQKLSKQVALLESLPEDFGVVYCWWEMFYDDRGEIADLPHKSNRGYLFDQMLYDNAIHGTPSLLFKKKLFEELGGLPDDPSVLPSDHFLLTKFSQKYKFDLVPEVLVRCHERHEYGSMGRQPSSRFSLEHRLNLSLRFYQTFREGYKIYPRAKKRILERIITGAAKAGCHRVFFKHLWLYLEAFPDLIFMIRAAYRYFYHMFMPTEHLRSK